MPSLTHCPICGFHKFRQFPPDSRDVYFFECSRCGEFGISDRCLLYEDVKKKIGEIGYILSGLSRELYETGEKYPTFYTDNFENYAKKYPVPDVDSIEEKMQKLLQRLREKTEFFGQEIEFEDIETAVPLAYAKNSDELMALLGLMKKKDLADTKIINSADGKKEIKITLSENSWNIANSLIKSNKGSERGFVAIWFDDAMNESIGAIAEAITECGFKPICIRDEHFSEKIMDKALGEIRQSRFVIVDLTRERPSVFFEAGFAHGLGIETIYVYRDDKTTRGTPLEFYVRHYKCYKYKDPADLKETLKNAIGARIKK